MGSSREGSTKPTKCVYVFVAEHGVEQKYKLVVKGELRQLGTRKIKRYLEKATGVPESRQRIFFGSEVLRDEWNGDDIGLYDGASLSMEPTRSPSRRSTDPAPGRQEIGSVAGVGDSQKRRTTTLSVQPESRATSRCLTFPDEAPTQTEGRQRSASPSLLTAAATKRSPIGRPASQHRDNTENAPTHRTWHAATRDRTPILAPHDDERPSTLSASRAASVMSNGSSSLYRHPVSLQGTRNLQGRPSTHSERNSSSESAWIPTRSSADSTRGNERPSVAFSSRRPSVSTSTLRDPRLSLLEAENDAMQRENALLRERLLDAERRALNEASRSDSRLHGGRPPNHAGDDEAAAHLALQDQIEELQDALLEKEAETEEAVREAEEKARVKEEELVRELDVLREERRRMRREQAAAEHEHRAAVESLQARVQTQRAEIQEQRETIEQLRTQLTTQRNRQHSMSPLSPCSPVRNGRAGSPKGISGSKQSLEHLSLDAMVQASLDRLALLFNAGELELDENNTCVLQVDTDDLTSSETISLLITLDCATERLYLYATVLSQLPQDANTRLRLYERLLEGALLGKDMAGAGVGVSMENGLVLMSTSVDVRRSDPSALAAAARPFVSAVKDWIEESERVLTLTR